MLFHDPISWAKAEMHCAQAAEERALNENYKLQSRIAELERELAEAREIERLAREYVASLQDGGDTAAITSMETQEALIAAVEQETK